MKDEDVFRLHSSSFILAVVGGLGVLAADAFDVGTDEQVAVAESADALKRIQGLASKLRGDDITAALNVIICDAQLPAYKKKCLEK